MIRELVPLVCDASFISPPPVPESPPTRIVVTDIFFFCFELVKQIAGEVFGFIYSH